MSEPAPPTPAPASQKPREVGDLVWLVPTSAMLHALGTALVVGVMFFRIGSCAIVGGTGSEGENGRGGAGGPTTEITVEGPIASQIGPTAPATPATEAQAQAQPAPETPPPTPAPETPPEPHPARAPRGPRPTAHTLTADRGSEDTAGPQQATEPVAARVTSPARPATGGTGDAQTSGGRAAGSIGAQRALLPHAVVCNDPVAGTWRAHKYDPMYGDWMFAVLRVHHEGGAAIRGSITVHAWDGGPSNVRPPACNPIDGFEFVVDEPAEGTLHGDRVDFGAVNYHLRRMVCNPGGRFFLYNPDHFSGTIDPRIQEFQSVNNDGGRDRNAPYVFRRVACEPGDEARPSGNDPGGPANNDPHDSAPPSSAAPPTPLPAAPARPPAPARPASEPPADWAPPGRNE